MPSLSTLASYWSNLGEASPLAYAETEVYTNTAPYTGPIQIPPPFEGFFFCGLKVMMTERSKADRTSFIQVKYLNQRLDESIQWLNQRVEVGSTAWSPAMYPIPRDIIVGTKLAIELEGLKDPSNTIVMVKCLYVEIPTLVSKSGWAFVDDRGGLQQFGLFTHESYWLSISQFHKLNATEFPVSAATAIPSMRRLLTGFNAGQSQVLETPDSFVWGQVSACV